MRLSRTALGLAVRAARGAARLTLKDLAELAGMTVSSLSRSENGERDLTFVEISAIATAVRVELEDLRTLAETFERDGTVAREGQAREMNKLQRLAIEAAIESRALT